MTYKETLLKLSELANNPGDPEIEHYEADCILVEFLHDLGYSDIVDQYSKIIKWYA